MNKLNVKKRNIYTAWVSWQNTQLLQQAPWEELMKPTSIWAETSFQAKMETWLWQEAMERILFHSSTSIKMTEMKSISRLKLGLQVLNHMK